jgi:bla regulator protein blaR1
MAPISSFAVLIGSAVHAVNLLLEWLLTYAIHSTLLIGGLFLVTSTTIGRRLVAGHGSWLWRFALVGAVITASLQSIRTSAPLAGTWRLDGDTPQRTMVRIAVHQDGPTVNTTPTWISLTGARHVTSSIQVRPLWPLYLLGAWFTIAAALVMWFLIARSRFLRFIGPRRPADHTLAGNALRHLRREGHIDRDVRLTVSERLTSPVALGGDEICLPSRAMSELGPVRIASILAHELAHLVRRDPTWLTIARMIEAIFFFQPLNILARRRMQEAAEFASDAWASTRVARPLDLAHCLARVAEWTIAAPRLPVPAMAERRGAALVRRVERLTTGRVVPERAPGRAVRLSAALALVGIVLLAPRAAIGADRSVDHVFNARVPGQGAILMLREVSSRPANRSTIRDFETFELRVRQN